MARLGYYVSTQLHKKGILKKFVVFSKGAHTTDFPCVPVSNLSRYILFVLNKVNRIFNITEHKFRLLQERLYDWLCRKHITADVDMLFTTNAHLKRTFKKAEKLGIRIIYVPANPEENYIYDLVTEEQEKLGIKEDEPYTYKPRLKYYNDSIPYVDTIVGTYPTVYDSYSKSSRGYNVVQINGHLKPDFKPRAYTERPDSDPYKVIYIASTVPLKGLQYLLEAWKELEGYKNLELHIVGRIQPSVKNYINKHFKKLKHVIYKGRVENVGGILEEMDLCVVPSLTDGGPYTALEAAHYGLPVILTENCGSAELLSRDPSGCIIIPIRDAEAIKQQILWAYNNRDKAKMLGKNAKYQLDNYDMQEFILQVADYLENELIRA